MKIQLQDGKVRSKKSPTSCQSRVQHNVNTKGKNLNRETLKQTTKRKNFTWKTGDVPRGVNCQKYKGDLARKKGKLGVLPVGVSVCKSLLEKRRK